MLKEVGLESIFERGDSGSLTQGDWEDVPDGWALGRKRAGAEGGEFGVSGVFGGKAKRARGYIEVERLGEVAGCRFVERLVAEG